MALVNPYCSEQQFREQFDDDSSVLPTAVVERAINATSRAIEKFTGRKFWTAEDPLTFTYRPDESDLAWIRDINSREDIVIRTDSAGDGTYATTWTADDYELGPDADADVDGDAYAWWRIHAVGTLRFPTVGQYRPLEVTALPGWSEIPANVEQACIIRSAAIFKRRESMSGVAGFDGFGAVRISRQRDPDVAALLDDFIKIKVGAV